MTSRAPVYILNQNAKREQGRKAQTANIKAARVSITFQKEEDITCIFAYRQCLTSFAQLSAQRACSRCSLIPWAA